MAQLKTLKFNDNVLQVTDSYTIDGSSFSLPNIEIGTIHIADECGGVVLHSYSAYGDVKVKDQCGTTTVSTRSDPSDGNLIFFYEWGSPCIGVGEKCGNFAVTDACGQEVIRYPCVWNEDDAQALYFSDGQGNGSQIAEHCGSVCLYDYCGHRVFSANQNGIECSTFVLRDYSGAISLSDTCGQNLLSVSSCGLKLYSDYVVNGGNGQFSVQDNCGTYFLNLKNGASINLKSFLLTDSCGEFSIRDLYGNSMFTIPSGRMIQADENGFLKLVSNH